jgi:hypothetical protein
MPNLTYFIWTQPADPLAIDVMTCDGVPVPAEDKRARQDLVSWVSALATSSKRRKLANGGFLIETSTASIAEVPVGPPDGSFEPIVTIALLASANKPSPQRLVDDVASAAEMAGHVPERGGLADVAVLLTREVGTNRPIEDSGRRWWMSGTRPPDDSGPRVTINDPDASGRKAGIGQSTNLGSPLHASFVAVWNWLRRFLGFEE